MRFFSAFADFRADASGKSPHPTPAPGYTAPTGDFLEYADGGNHAREDNTANA
jgi:hypothetical protein